MYYNEFSYAISFNIMYNCFFESCVEKKSDFYLYIQ